MNRGRPRLPEGQRKRLSFTTRIRQALAAFAGTGEEEQGQALNPTD